METIKSITIKSSGKRYSILAGGDGYIIDNNGLIQKEAVYEDAVIKKFMPLKCRVSLEWLEDSYNEADDSTAYRLKVEATYKDEIVEMDALEEVRVVLFVKRYTLPEDESEEHPVLPGQIPEGQETDIDATGKNEVVFRAIDIPQLKVSVKHRTDAVNLILTPQFKSFMQTGIGDVSFPLYDEAVNNDDLWFLPTRGSIQDWNYSSYDQFSVVPLITWDVDSLFYERKNEVIVDFPGFENRRILFVDQALIYEREFKLNGKEMKFNRCLTMHEGRMAMLYYSDVLTFTNDVSLYSNIKGVTEI